MSRTLSVPYASSARKLSIVAPVNKGGTGGVDVVSAAAGLGAVSRTSLGLAGGAAKTQAGGQLGGAALPGAVITGVMVDGPDTISINSTSLFSITNYDVNTTYAASCSVGTISQVADVLTYVAPSTPQTATITLNGRVMNITISPIQPLAPSITSPVAGSTGLAFATLAITASAFALPSGTPNHLSSDWQVSTDPAFVNVVASSFNDTVNKTSWSVSNLTLNTRYYTRVRYKDSVYGYGDWSKGSVFTTRATMMAGVEEAKLLASDPASGDNFGYSVSMTADGSRVAIGAYNKTGTAGTLQGTAYIFTRSGSTWTQETKLLTTDPAGDDFFGASVSITSDGSRVVIGAHYKTGSTGAGQGAVYIFTRSGTIWTQEAKLLASDPASQDRFGASVSITADGSRVAIGANQKTGPGGTQQGVVYIFLRTGTAWVQEAKLLASDGASGDYFGTRASITSDGSRVMIGAYQKTGTAGTSQGAAYVFTRSGTTWTQEAKLLASDPAASDSFGFSISITSDGSRVAIGAYYKTGTAGTSQGAVYIFTRSGSSWTQEAKLLVSDPAVSDSFGVSVSITADGSRVAIGAYQKTGSTASQGAVYIFTRSGVTWSQETKLLASDPGAGGDNFGYSVSIAADGSRVAIGARYKTGSAGTMQGAVYIEA